MHRASEREMSLEVFVTGALHSRIGKPGLIERTLQTQQTMESVSRTLPGARIFYVDGGAEALRPDEKNLITRGHAGRVSVEVLDLSAEDEIQAIHDSATRHPLRDLRAFQGYYKSSAESMALALAFKQVGERGCSSVLKLSGRYIVEPKFKRVMTFYADTCSPSLGALRATSTYLRPRVPGFDEATVTISWLARGFEKGALSKKMLRSFSILQESISMGNVIDLEHAFQKTIENEPVERFRSFGISGVLASSGRKTRV